MSEDPAPSLLAAGLSTSTTIPLVLQADRESNSAIAPWWHTALLVALIAAVSLFGLRHRVPSTPPSPHFRLYSRTIAWEWALAGFAYWGIRLRRVPMRRLLGERRPGFKAWEADFGVALTFWILFLPVLGLITVALRHAYLNTGVKISERPASQKNDGKTAFKIPSQSAARQRIVRLAPESGKEMLLWIALSVSAGICEEFVFRGYLQQQFASLIGKPSIRGPSIGILSSAILFGAAHAYEGVTGMVAVAALGAVFSLLVLRRRNLRSSMMMHAWHDVVAGLMIFLLKHAHRI